MYSSSVVICRLHRIEWESSVIKSHPVQQTPLTSIDKSFPILRSNHAKLLYPSITYNQIKESNPNIDHETLKRLEAILFTPWCSRLLPVLSEDDFCTLLPNFLHLNPAVEKSELKQLYSLLTNSEYPLVLRKKERISDVQHAERKRAPEEVKQKNRNA